MEKLANPDFITENGHMTISEFLERECDEKVSERKGEKGTGLGENEIQMHSPSTTNSCWIRTDYRDEEAPGRAKDKVHEGGRRMLEESPAEV
eukprot:439272-Amorphochlora_amoeboformis.AAC.1